MPILIFFGGYELLLRKANLPNIYKFKDDLINSDYNSLVLGNSHALRGIIAEDIKSYNTISLANVSQSMDVDFMWLEEVVKVKSLKLVILNFSVPSLTGDLSTSIESWRVKNYNIYTRLSMNYSFKANLEFLNGTNRDNFDALGGYLEGKSDDRQMCLSKGSFPMKIEESVFLPHAIEASKRQTEQHKYIKRNKDLLSQIIFLSKTHDFKLILITPPAHSSYRELIPNEIKSELFVLAEEAQSRNGNVYWLNYFDDLNFHDIHFKDSNHLNFNGATLLTNNINVFLDQNFPNK